MFKLLLVGAFAVLTGCASMDDGSNATISEGGTDVKTSTSNMMDDGASTRGMDTDEANGNAMSEDAKYSMQALDDPNSPLSVRTIYFAFDSTELTPESSETLIEHARFLTLNPSVSVVLEGHTDERGTREYNLALGEGRSKSVFGFLTSQGVNASQLEVISFGEEQPVAPEHNETAWQLNRRVEMVYTTK
ncbi:MAG: peptidoglycan-associated lipoprotein Pal [Gammaproteobacteria bacterium]|nr:peptidoglycan-associated lipoprotein Pal [Gammaproteobacteria bacterium]